MINSDYLDNLNKAQKEAVLHLDGPLLIVAGAGSGKTKVLTSRIAHIIKKKKAFPNQILSVTFTNKAAKEMQNRVSKILGSAAIGLSWLGTFHSICAKLLRKHASASCPGPGPLLWVRRQHTGACSGRQSRRDRQRRPWPRA